MSDERRTLHGVPAPEQRKTLERRPTPDLHAGYVPTAQTPRPSGPPKTPAAVPVAKKK